MHHQHQGITTIAKMRTLRCVTLGWMCHAWMNVSLDAFVGMGQLRDHFWGGIAEYYNNTVEVTSSCTQGYLGRHCDTKHDLCNRWSRCIHPVNHAPPSGMKTWSMNLSFQTISSNGTRSRVTSPSHYTISMKSFSQQEVD